MPSQEADDIERDQFGIGLKAPSRHYRAYVGHSEAWDVLGALQFSLLFTLGLRETHHLADVGCGSLRAGRLLIPYLRPGHYFGIDPEEWLVQEGIDRELGRAIVDVKQPVFRYADDFSIDAFGVPFDFVLAHSIFTHCYSDLATAAVPRIAAALAPEGYLVGTLVEDVAQPEVAALPGVTDGAGWQFPGTIRYDWEWFQRLLGESGLTGRRVVWPHFRQTWFVAAHTANEDALDAVVRQVAGGAAMPAGGRTVDAAALRTENARLRSELVAIRSSPSWRLSRGIAALPSWARRRLRARRSSA